MFLSFLKYCGTRNVPHSISEIEFYALIEKVCTFCRGKIGLNRIIATNPLLGIISGNVKTICVGCASRLYPFPH